MDNQNVEDQIVEIKKEDEVTEETKIEALVSSENVGVPPEYFNEFV